MATRCKDCVFAEWDGDTQVGCAANMLEKFQQQEALLTPETDGVKTYCVIQNRICLMHRPVSWKNKQERGQPADLIKVARKEITLSYEGFIFADTQPLTDIQSTFYDLMGQTLPPKKITVILNHDYLHPARLIRWLKGKRYATEWKIAHIHEKNTREWCLEHAIHNAEQPYHILLNAGQTISYCLAAKIDGLLNDDLCRFSLLLLTKDEQNYFIQTSLHKQLSGYNLVEVSDDENMSNLIDKIKFCAREQHLDYLIKKIEDIPHGN